MASPGQQAKLAVPASKHRQSRVGCASVKGSKPRCCQPQILKFMHIFSKIITAAAYWAWLCSNCFITFSQVIPIASLWQKFITVPFYRKCKPLGRLQPWRSEWWYGVWGHASVTPQSMHLTRLRWPLPHPRAGWVGRRWGSRRRLPRGAERPSSRPALADFHGLGLGPSVRLTPGCLNTYPLCHSPPEKRPLCGSVSFNQRGRIRDTNLLLKLCFS